MTVLIVDDQPDVVRGEQQGIDWEKLGIGRILTAYSVPEARELLLGERVYILLCDIEMPPHSGLELLSLIREQKLPARCIFLSAHAEFTYAQEAVRLGGFDYILQPAPYSEIEEAVARALQDIKEKEPAEMPQPAETAGGTPAYTGSSSPVASAQGAEYVNTVFCRNRRNELINEADFRLAGPGYLPGGDRRGDFLKP